ncbi:hypothetical protein Nocox_00320 [Nonomuraea coxensis DSM 45129]|uniref:Uncharacterized protein n=1 Tax=Nonomuraea coxensis DSM 45129 TaxID=1122611 RepID=A0ABX8TRG1_9ACTN|nr:hypothetical protein [Nonomuraea coxensis]QYC37703.1 hypothetical protein Nocox_00320 [Nonomuraea coxensis DSM 45129]
MGAAVVSTLTLAMTATLVGAVLADTPLSDDGWPGWPASPPGTILDATASSGEPAERELSSAPSKTPPTPSRSAFRREPGPRTPAAPSRTRQMTRSASPTTASARPSRTSEPPERAPERAPATGRETEAAVEPELGTIHDIVPPRKPEATASPEPESIGQPSPAPAAIASGAPA